MKVIRRGAAFSFLLLRGGYAFLVAMTLFGTVYASCAEPLQWTWSQHGDGCGDGGPCDTLVCTDKNSAPSQLKQGYVKKVAGGYQHSCQVSYAYGRMVYESWIDGIVVGSDETLNRGKCAGYYAQSYPNSCVVNTNNNWVYTPGGWGMGTWSCSDQPGGYGTITCIPYGSTLGSSMISISCVKGGGVISTPFSVDSCYNGFIQLCT